MERHAMRASTLVSLIVLFCLSLPATAAVIVVDQAGGGDYETIQEGIHAAAAFDTVLVLPGTYYGPGNYEINFLGKAITVTSAPARDLPVVDCGYDGRGFILQNGETAGSVLRGFHVYEAYGGGVVCDGASPTIQDCWFERGSASNGAGVEVLDGSPQIINCVFLNNLAGAGGGGLRCSGAPSNPQVKGCLFKENDADFGGGVMTRQGAVPNIENCVFEGNTAAYSGGMRFEAGSATLTSCLFKENHAVSGGAMGSGYYSTPTLRYVTCIDNTASMRGACFADGTYADIQYCTFVGGASPNGGGMFCGEPFGTMDLRNSIIAFSSEGAAVTCDAIGCPTITHCCVFGNAGGDLMCGNAFDNLFEDPMFCGLGNGDLTVHEESPCLPANNSWGEMIGAHEQGCEGAVPVEKTSWGAVKAMYR
jgi:hypothetical protein